ncbi:MAG: HAMP domain-containing sensor histidine kinase [Halodesulfurarchaeum sp.]|nr:HAMP domain-containing sensor histidine kinase [Halodesulfurarchaeum sp.]
MSEDLDPWRSVFDHLLTDFDPEVVPSIAWGLFVTGLGFVFAFGHAIHLRESHPLGTVLIGVVIPLLIAVGIMIPFGLILALPNDSFQKNRVAFIRQLGPWMAGWMAVGMGWMGIAGVGSVLYQAGVGLYTVDSAYLVAIFASYGVIPGTITGYYYGRTVQSATEVAERERHLTVFMRVLRHNFRNEMNVILGELGLAEELSPQEAAKHVRKASRHGQSLMETVEKQRYLVGIVTDPEPPQVQLLSGIVETAVEEIRERYPGAVVSAPDPPQISVSAHPQIDRALVELLENAIVHSTAETPRAVIEIGREADQVALSIHDSGTRIPTEEISILAGDTDPDQLEHGSGLGLWIVDRLIDQSGGSFEAGTGPDGGNEVVLWLPLAD